MISIFGPVVVVPVAVEVFTELGLENAVPVQIFVDVVEAPVAILVFTHGPFATAGRREPTVAVEILAGLEQVVVIEVLEDVEGAVTVEVLPFLVGDGDDGRVGRIDLRGAGGRTGAVLSAWKASLSGLRDRDREQDEKRDDDDRDGAGCEDPTWAHDMSPYRSWRSAARQWLEPAPNLPSITGRRRACSLRHAAGSPRRAAEPASRCIRRGAVPMAGSRSYFFLNRASKASRAELGASAAGPGVTMRRPVASRT